MAKLFLVNIDMHGNEIQNVVLQPLAAAPQNPTVGRIYYDTTDKVLKTYDGTNWSAVGAVLSVNGKTGTVVITQDDVANGSTYVRTHNDLTDSLLTLINGALQKSGGTMSGAIAMGNNKITGLANGTAATDAATFGQIPTAYTSNPAMDGTASAGTSTSWAKGDHVHPTDTSRMAANLKGVANGVASLDAEGCVPLDQMPQSVLYPASDVVYGYYISNLGGFYEDEQGTSEITGDTEKLYVNISGTPETLYRYDGLHYLPLNAYNDVNPVMDGVANPGTVGWARGDHVHPTDTSRMAASLRGTANGVAELDANGKVPSSQLPAYVDDVVEGYYYNSKFYKEAAHTTEIAGETGKIYVDLSTEKTYRWSGTAFVEISASLALGETSSTAYRGDRGKAAYDHSQLTSGNPHNVSKSDVGLGNVDNTSDATKKTNFTGSIASGNTGFVTGGDANTALTSLVKVKMGVIVEDATSATVTVPTGYTLLSYYAVKNNAEVTVDASFTFSWDSPYYISLPNMTSITFTTAVPADSNISIVVNFIKTTAYNGQIEM